MNGYTWNWLVIWQYRAVWPEALMTAAQLALTAAVFGFLLGLGLAYLSIARQPALRLAGIGAGRLIRSTPLLLLVFIFYLVAPQWGVRLFDAPGSFAVALSIVAAGYMAENLRAGLIAVPQRVMEAGKGIGLTSFALQRDIVLPIALRHALPALGNSVVSIFKDTSVASIIAVPELAYIAKEISTDYFRVFEAWATVSAIYLAVTAVLTVLLRLLEARLPGRAA